jgi:hypothetical protein
MQISEQDYYERFEAYLKECGSNPGTTFFGAWGWYAARKNEFDAIMQEDGIVVTPSK